MQSKLHLALSAPPLLALGALSGCIAEPVSPENTPPTASISSPAGGEQFAEGALITFLAQVQDDQQAPQTLSAAWTSDLDGGLASSVASETGQLEHSTSDLQEGTHLITLTVHDDDYATAYDTVQITIASTDHAPSIAVLSPEDGDLYTTDEAISFTAVVSDPQDAVQDLAVTVTTSGQEICSALPDATGVVDCEKSLPEGDHHVVFTVIDRDGNDASDSLSVTVEPAGDTAGPVDTGDSARTDSPDDSGDTASPGETGDTGSPDDDGDGWTLADGDCDDDEATTHPGASEICKDGVDNDCDGAAGACDLSGTLDLGTADVRWDGESGTDFLGGAVSGAGDVDGDGLDDIFISARGDDDGAPSAGAVYLILGSVSGAADLTSAHAKITGEEDGDYAGKSVASAGDVNGDGQLDVVIGAYGESSNAGSAGAAYLVHGPISGATTLADAAADVLGEAEHDYAGHSVAGAGDTDNDGYEDVLVGAYQQDAGGDDAGAAYLLLGPFSGDLELAEADAMLIGESADDEAGYAVSGAGDVDGDGLADVLVGATDESSVDSDAGAAYLLLGPISGATDLSLADAKLTGEAAGDEAGSSVAAAGDTNGDGYDDALVGAWDEDSGGSAAGALYLVLGPFSDQSLSASDAKFIGETSYGAVGSSACSAGDFDGDGEIDLLIGANSEDSVGTNAGAAYLVSGPFSGSLDLSSATAKLTGEGANYSAGGSVASAGDFDGDGFDDLLIGSPGASVSASSAGAAYLFLGTGL